MNSVQINSDQPVFNEEGGLLLPTAVAAGPWFPGTQHGSAMMLMAAIAAERYPWETPHQVTRLTVDMMNAAPLAPIELVTAIRKKGQSMEVLDISIQSAGKEYLRASALRTRTAAVPVPSHFQFNEAAVPRLPAPSEQSLSAHDLITSVAKIVGFHFFAVELRIDIVTRPAVLWIRLTKPVLPTLFATPLLRVALAADWTYCIPALAHHVAHQSRYGAETFSDINSDTTINLHRPAVGEWIGIQTTISYGNLGAGVATGQLFDEQGHIGCTSQTLLLRNIKT